MVSLSTIHWKGLAALALTLALGACTVVSYEQARPPAAPAPVPQPAPEPDPPRERLVVPQQPGAQAPSTPVRPASLPAAQRMRQLASAAGEKGEHRRAIALLERALRISPRDPETYYQLARHHLLLDDAAQALQLAQRGLSLQPSDDQRRRLQQLVADCKARLSA